MWIITGATGFIGSALAWELNNHGQDDLVLVDHVPPSERPGIIAKRKYREFVRADELVKFLERHKSEVKGIYHMGACSNTTETNAEYLEENNVRYSQRVFDFCTRQSVPLIYASSGACYGDGQLGFDDQTDSDIFKPLNLYGWSKVNFDKWAVKQSKTPPRWYGLRFFNVYGPNEYHKGDQASVVFKAFQQISETGKLRLFRSHNPKYADGEQLRDFIYVKDVTRWMWEIMGNEKVHSGIYNMGFGKARPWNALASVTFASLSKPMQIDWIDIPQNIRNQYQYFTQAKVDRLLGEGLAPANWSLEDGIFDYVSKYLQKKDPYL
ncbi:MAG: ADP-glyceromanno-heptose 6-epimerase [Bdellovibrionales bacterium]